MSAVKGGAYLHVDVAVKVHDYVNVDDHAHVNVGRASGAAPEYPGRL